MVTEIPEARRSDPRFVTVTRTPKSPQKDLRPDIQLLRAVAVGAVLLYHLWPNRMTGGFVGVDVFFVISGFLITSHLLRSATRGSGISLARFWGNRARRLLPLASIVLLLTVVGTLLFMPASTWSSSLKYAMGSALYVQNWMLAEDSVNYLARDQTPSPTQHFWSLSVEEQFYIGWPLLLLLAVAVAGAVVRRTGGDRALAVRRAAFVAVGVVLVGSFAYSLYLTATRQSIAYFATTTRAWEFALGGLVVFLGRRGDTADPDGPRDGWWWGRWVACWSGAALIVGSCFLITEATPFPGTAAVFPVVGAALMLWAGDVRGIVAPTNLARLRPLTWIGDISYGIYLWHWPMIIILPFATADTALSTLDKVAILASSVALAALSKATVEDPFRFGTFWTSRTRRGFYPGLAGIVAVCLMCTTALIVIGRTATATAAVTTALPSDTLSRPTDPAAPLVPSIANRSTDYGQMFECFDFDASGPHECTYGPEDATVSIALVGDSHAAQFIPALIAAADTNKWRLTTITGMNCDAGLLPACGGGQQGFDDIVAGQFDLVLVSAFRGSYSPVDGVTDYLTRLQQAGVRLLPIDDVPFHPTATYACIDASDGDAGKAAACTTSTAAALQEVPDRIAPIARSLGIESVNLDDIFCSTTECRSVIGNVLVYQDSPSSHLTATFSRLLAPRLGEAIAAALPR